MGTLGCINDMMRRDKENRELRKAGKERLNEAEHLDWEWHDGKMKTRLEYRLLKNEWQGQQ